MNLPIYEELDNSEIRHILVRHEQLAAHMADGFARVSRRPGVCLATSGPGDYKPRDWHCDRVHGLDTNGCNHGAGCRELRALERMLSKSATSWVLQARSQNTLSSHLIPERSLSSKEGILHRGLWQARSSPHRHSERHSDRRGRDGVP